MKLEKVGMSPNCWDKSWDFQHFSWEIQRLGSSNTAAVSQAALSDYCERDSRLPPVPTPAASS